MEIILILCLKNIAAYLIFFYAHNFYILNKILLRNKTDLCNGYQNMMCSIPDKNENIKTSV